MKGSRNLTMEKRKDKVQELDFLESQIVAAGMSADQPVAPITPPDEDFYDECDIFYTPFCEKLYCG